MKWKSVAACFALLPIAACGTQENPPAGSTPVTSGFKVERQFTYPAEFAPGKAYSPGSSKTFVWKKSVPLCGMPCGLAPSPSTR